MKAVLLSDQEFVNPVYLAVPNRKGVKQILIRPAGEVIDDPDCWRLCALGVASPEDDECRAKVLAFMGSPARVAMLGKIKSLIASEGVQKLDAKTQKWLDQMKKSYAAELGLSPSDAA